MSFFELILYLTIIGCITGVLKSFFESRQKVAEARLKATAEGSEKLVEELRDLKKQVADLRDTTTQYDVSFDAALQRLEGRTANIEQRMTQAERKLDATHVQGVR